MEDENNAEVNENIVIHSLSPRTPARNSLWYTQIEQNHKYDQASVSVHTPYSAHTQTHCYSSHIQWINLLLSDDMVCCIYWLAYQALVCVFFLLTYSPHLPVISTRSSQVAVRQWNWDRDSYFRCFTLLHHWRDSWGVPSLQELLQTLSTCIFSLTFSASVPPSLFLFSQSNKHVCE